MHLYVIKHIKELLQASIFSEKRNSCPWTQAEITKSADKC